MRIAAAIAFVLCAACSSAPKAQWAEDRVTAASDRVLWQVTVLALEKNQFPIGSGLEPGKLIAVSGWHTSLAPFKGKGYREQCEIQYESTGDRTFGVKVRVRRETNEELAKPLDPSYAHWEPAPDQPDRALTVLRYIKALLGGEFRMGDKAPTGTPGRT